MLLLLPLPLGVDTPRMIGQSSNSRRFCNNISSLFRPPVA
jgi:hypothetical protein